MKEVLVTGHTGFMGTAVTEELLARGWHVTGLSRERRLPEREGLRQVTLDLLDREAVSAFFRRQAFDAVIHLAWYIGPKCHGHDVNMAWLEASLHLLFCFQQAGGRVFQGCGTVSEYDFSWGYLSEDRTPLVNGSLHGACKAALYGTARAFCAGHGMTFKWPRPFNLYGPNERPSRLMPGVILSALRGEDIRVSECRQMLDYLYVGDTARGIVDIFESDATDAVNVCSGKPVQLRAVVERIAALTDFRGNIRWGAIPAAVEYPLIAGSNRKLAALGWEPKVSLEEGLKKTVEWWKRRSCRV